jgi:hypothetical protein
MTPNELLLAQSLKDAIAMLRWQAVRPISAQSWAEWTCSAIAALDDVQRPIEDTQVFTGPFTKEQLRRASLRLNGSMQT